MRIVIYHFKHRIGVAKDRAGDSMAAVNAKTITNEISIDHNGNCTVVGALAHRLWVDKQFPTLIVSANRFYVLEKSCLPKLWDVKAAQTTRRGALRYMTDTRVLVNLSDAPKSHLL